MLTKGIAIDKSRKLISELRREGYNPDEAILFGSIINGHVHEYSDIDLALWDKKFKGAPIIDYEPIKRILVRHNPIELHPFPSGERENDNPFIEVIKKTGEHIDLNF